WRVDETPHATAAAVVRLFVRDMTVVVVEKHPPHLAALRRLLSISQVGANRVLRRRPELTVDRLHAHDPPEPAGADNPDGPETMADLLRGERSDAVRHAVHFGELIEVGRRLAHPSEPVPGETGEHRHDDQPERHRQPARVTQFARARIFRRAFALLLDALALG